MSARAGSLPVAVAAGAAAPGAAPAVAGGAAAQDGRSWATTTSRRDKLTVNKGTTITLEVARRRAGDVHDVKLKSGPKGVQASSTPSRRPAATATSARSAPGTYKIVCTLHEEMTMTIRVRR